jgi:hypothetical protein
LNVGFLRVPCVEQLFLPVCSDAHLYVVLLLDLREALNRFILIFDVVLSLFEVSLDLGKDLFSLLVPLRCHFNLFISGLLVLLELV